MSIFNQNVYVSGRISNMEREEAEKRFEVGVRMAWWVLGILSWNCVNPIKKEVEGEWSQEQWMSHWKSVIFSGEIKYMIMCEGWEESAGACQEHEWAIELGIKVLYVKRLRVMLAEYFRLLNMVEQGCEGVCAEALKLSKQIKWEPEYKHRIKAYSGDNSYRPGETVVWAYGNLYFQALARRGHNKAGHIMTSRSA